MKNIRIPADLKNHVRKKAKFYFNKYEVNSIGIGLKNLEEEAPAIIFGVSKKFGLETLAENAIEVIPEYIEVGGIKFKTDVIERTYKVKAIKVKPENSIQSASGRKSYCDPVKPGVSISHHLGTAGTAGCVVYDAYTSEQYILSNWHVLHGEDGLIGDEIVQPGPHDDNRIKMNLAGTLIRSHLGVAGDCAIARIDYRTVDDRILGLDDTFVEFIGDPYLGDMVIKSGRTTNVTYGIVSQVNMTCNINYGSIYNPKYVAIGCFEISPSPSYPAIDGEISRPGDSGAAWMYFEPNTEETTNLLLGLHFAGETDDGEYALACYPSSVFEKLEILPSSQHQLESLRTNPGFNETFLSEKLFLPKPLKDNVRNDLYIQGDDSVINYMHFSLTMSKSRKIALWVGWNVDGGRFQPIRGNTSYFRKDGNISFDYQIGNELYAGNDLDRGHLARRADLVWGGYEEAKQANKDSYYYTNIAPQHYKFNRSSAGGIWGEIENAIYLDLAKPGSKYSVFAGPVFSDSDKEINNIQIPNAFWKIVYYQDKATQRIVSRAYIVTQVDLIDDITSQIESLEDYQVYQISINRVQQLTGFDFPNKSQHIGSIESLNEGEFIVKINSYEEIIK
jgi:endonuclease G